MTQRRPPVRTGARTQVRLLHTSDLHIGGEMTAEPHRCGWMPCVCPALDVAIMAQQAEVDVILACGDLFDHSRLDDAVVRHVFGILASPGVPCVVLPGNHDPMDDQSLYWRPWLIAGEPAIRVIRAAGGEAVAPLGADLTVWGRPVVVHSPDYRPLVEVPARPVGTNWYVVLAHGHYLAVPDAADGIRPRRSSPILRSELDRIDADYVALGHWHQAARITVDPPTWYSGWPHNAGPPGGALVVDLIPGQVAAVTELRLPTTQG
jgi:DNA repair exonuclease SbcCD nuclease subunit